MQPYELTATEASRLIAAKKLSCEELARSTLAYIAKRDPLVKAWTYVDDALVIRNARELDKMPVTSPLHGLTFGVKDVIETYDMPTQQNSPLYQGHQSGQDAACVAVVRHSGALIVGKTDTVEFASGARMAASCNPHNLAYTPGGSSSGSGAAVGDKQVQLAFGTQTGGSHIRPASYNGIYGIKPTHGVVSREGAKQYSATLDTIGWYGRSVDDLQLVADAFQLLGPQQAVPIKLQGLKVGLCQAPAWDLADAYAQEALMLAARRLEAAGATIIHVVLPEPFNRLDDAQHTVMFGEGRAAFLPEMLSSRRLLLAKHFQDIVTNAHGITAEKLVQAYDLAAMCRQEFDGLFGQDLDVVLTPSCTGEPPIGYESSGDPVFNAMWTLLHVPCVGIPVGKSPKNLPLGIQLIGPRFADLRLLQIAKLCAPAIHEHNTLSTIEI